MARNIKDNIIVPSWNMITEDFALKKFYIIPWFLGFTFLMVLLVYQFTYTYVELFGNTDEVFKILLNLFHSTYLVPILITWSIFLILYFILYPIFEVGLIHKINCKSQNIELDSWDAIGKWMLTFLPMFEYNNAFSTLKFMSIFNTYLFAIRFIGVEYIYWINLVFIILVLVSFIVNVLFSYAKYYVILEWEKIFKAITNSIKLSTVNIVVTLKLYLLMFVLNLRVILNLFLFLLIPVWIIWAVTYISSQFFIAIAITIVWIVWILIYLLLMYISTILEVFKAAVWYFAYKDCKANMKIIDDSIKK